MNGEKKVFPLTSKGPLASLLQWGSFENEERGSCLFVHFSAHVLSYVRVWGELLYVLEGRFEGKSIGCGVCVWRLALRNRRGGPSSYLESGDSVPCG